MVKNTVCQYKSIWESSMSFKCFIVEANLDSTTPLVDHHLREAYGLATGRLQIWGSFFHLK